MEDAAGEFSALLIRQVLGVDAVSADADDDVLTRHDLVANVVQVLHLLLKGLA